MPTTSTTRAVWRSNGGDNTGVSYAGSMVMVADFYFLPTAANTTPVQRSATDTRSIVLPPGAIVLEIYANAAGTGGATPTFDMGWIGVNDATQFDVDDLVAEGDADVGKSVYNWATVTAGADLGAVLSATQPVTITGGVGASAATGGAISGRMMYYVPTDGAVAQ